jgi:ABC-2 type transport system ATP-binding protein
VLLTTQYLEEADQLADRIAVIEHGKVIAEGTSAELKASIATGVLHVTIGDASRRDAARDILAARLDAPVRLETDGRSLTAQVSDPDRAAAALAALTAAGISMSDFSLGQPSLDEVFFALTGRTAEATSNAEAPTSTIRETAP